MRMIVTGLAAALLAGCGSGLVQLDEGNHSGPAAGGTGAPNTPNNPGPIRPGRNTREATVAACVEDLGRNLPRGTDLQALCGCAVDRMIAGTPQMEAVRQCAAEQRVTLPGQ